MSKLGAPSLGATASSHHGQPQSDLRWAQPPNHHQIFLCFLNPLSDWFGACFFLPREPHHAHYVSKKPAHTLLYNVITTKLEAGAPHRHGPATTHCLKCIKEVLS